MQGVHSLLTNQDWSMNSWTNVIGAGHFGVPIKILVQVVGARDILAGAIFSWHNRFIYISSLSTFLGYFQDEIYIDFCPIKRLDFSVFTY